jgi:hypothetical protein
LVNAISSTKTPGTRLPGVLLLVEMAEATIRRSCDGFVPSAQPTTPSNAMRWPAVHLVVQIPIHEIAKLGGQANPQRCSQSLNIAGPSAAERQAHAWQPHRPKQGVAQVDPHRHGSSRAFPLRTTKKSAMSKKPFVDG